MQEKDYDIIIVGAGAAGVAAALQASEHNARTLLVDDGPCPGGDFALGLLNHWSGESASSVMEGVRAFSRRAWGRSIVEPEDMAAHLAGLLGRARVDTLWRARTVKLTGKGPRIKGISLATPAGRAKLGAYCFVDATEDSALARLRGCPFDETREPSLTLLARIGGIDTRTPGVFDGEALRQYADRFRSEQACEELPTPMSYPQLIPCPRGGTAVLNAAAPGLRPAATAFEQAAAEALCREHAHAAIGFLQRNVPGYENCYLIHFAHRPLLVDRPRALRCRTAVPMEPGSIEDAVVLAHKAGSSAQTTPLGALLCRDVENLLMATDEHTPAENLSLQLQLGSAVGRVAALSLLYDGALRKIDPNRLRRALADDDAPDHDFEP